MRESSDPRGLFVAQIARMNYDGEIRPDDDPNGDGFYMQNDDAVETLSSLIREARRLLGWPV